MSAARATPLWRKAAAVVMLLLIWLLGLLLAADLLVLVGFATMLVVLLRLLRR